MVRAMTPMQHDPTPVEQAARAVDTRTADLLARCGVWWGEAPEAYDVGEDRWCWLGTDGAGSAWPIDDEITLALIQQFTRIADNNFARLDAALDSPRVYEHDAEYHWIVENDGHGSSRIVAQNVLPGFGDWVASRSVALGARLREALPDDLSVFRPTWETRALAAVIALGHHNCASNNGRQCDCGLLDAYQQVRYAIYRAAKDAVKAAPDSASPALDATILAVAINDAQVLGTEWWGKDLVPVAEKIIRLYTAAVAAEYAKEEK